MNISSWLLTIIFMRCNLIQLIGGKILADLVWLKCNPVYNTNFLHRHIFEKFKWKKNINKCFTGGSCKYTVRCNCLHITDMLRLTCVLIFQSAFSKRHKILSKQRSLVKLALFPFSPSAVHWSSSRFLFSWTHLFWKIPQRMYDWWEVFVVVCLLV